MKILSDAEDIKDIPSLEIVQNLISKVVAKTVPCDNEVITENYKLGTNVQTALSNLLTYTYVNASGIGQLSTSLQSAWNAINAISTYTGGSGIVVSGSVIGHSNNLTSEGTVNTSEIQSPDFGENATLTWFKYDKQGHVTSTGSGGIKIPVADTTLSSTSTRPISSKAVYDNLIASVIRATTRTVGTGDISVSIYDDVQETLEGFQSHIYKLHTDITSLGSDVGVLNTYKDSINISAGSTTVPVYFNNGVPTVCQYTLGSICTKSTSDYLPITGGTLTGKLTANADICIPTGKSTADNSVPLAGSANLTITNADFTQLKNYKSFIGGVNDTTNNVWYDAINVRHRNGYNDGANYGMYIRTKLISSGDLIWNKQTAASTWQGERTIIDSGNYTSYFVVDSKLNTGSTNAIQNKVVATEINSVKSALDDTNTVVSDLANNLQGAYNKFANYLPLSGGTVTGTTTFSQAELAGQLKINRASTASGVLSVIDYLVNNSRVGVLGFSDVSALRVKNASNADMLTVDSSGNGTFIGSVTAKSFVGNATSASKLATARTINGVSFDGSANIIIPRSTKHIHVAAGTEGSAGYVKIATIKVTGEFANHPVEFVISQRSRGPYHLYVQFNSVSSTDPTLYQFKHFDPTNKGVNAYIVKSATSTWDIYIGKIEGYDHIYILDVLKADGNEGACYSITYTNTLVSAVPTTNRTKSTAVSFNGTASSATKLTTSAGSATVPVYFSGGVPTECTYELNKTVPADAVFTDGRIDQKNSSGNFSLPLLLGFNSDDDVNGFAWKNSKFKANPSTGELFASTFNGQIAWGNVTGKPSSFTPSSHSHSMSDISNLNTTINSLSSTLNSINTALTLHKVSKPFTKSSGQPDLIVRAESYVQYNDYLWKFYLYFTNAKNISANTETVIATTSYPPKYTVVKTGVSIWKNNNSAVHTNNATVRIKSNGDITITTPTAISGTGVNYARMNGEVFTAVNF